VLSELGQNIKVKLALERDDQVRWLLGSDPPAGIEFRVLGCEVDIVIAAGETHDKPFLALPR